MTQFFIQKWMFTLPNGLLAVLMLTFIITAPSNTFYLNTTYLFKTTLHIIK